MIDAEQAPAEQPSFFGSVNVVMVTYALDGALALATSVLIAREVGPEGRGAYGLFLLTAAFGAMLLGLGIGNAAIYYLNKRELTLPQALAAAHTVTLAATAVTALVVGVVAPVTGGSWLEKEISPWLLIAAVPAILYLQLLRMLLQGLHRWVDLGITTIGQQVALLGLVTITVVATDASPQTFIVYHVVASAAAAVYALLRIGLRNVDVGAVVRPQGDTLRRLAGFGLQGETGNILQLLNYRLDQYLVRAFVSLAGVGIYATAVSLTEGVFILANAVALVLMPRLTAADSEEAGWLAPVASRNTVLLAAGMSVGMAITAPLLLPWFFGHAFEDSVQALWLLLPGTVALAGSKVLTSYIFSRGKPLVNTMITVAGLIITLGADLALIPWLGVNGAAIASSLAYIVHFAASLYAYGRISGQPVLDAIIPRRADARLYADAMRGLRKRAEAPQPAGR